jgi:hypothetical protein
MSALPPKADMCVALAYVRFGPIAGIVAIRVSALLDHLAGNGGEASSVKLKVVPGPLLRDAHTRPPCASIMDSN